tara:strand:+ start:338 stop:697 length:360 start_codon:yes stop_codon:yes gene_type:complete
MIILVSYKEIVKLSKRLVFAVIAKACECLKRAENRAEPSRAEKRREKGKREEVRRRNARCDANLFRSDPCTPLTTALCARVFFIKLVPVVVHIKTLASVVQLGCSRRPVMLSIAYFKIR